jgi:hypothetical protein
MTKKDYEFVIARGDIAKDLHALGAEIRADDELFTTDKAELLEKIRLKFCQLNAQALGPQKSRW